jgi:hypothetical protein
VLSEESTTTSPFLCNPNPVICVCAKIRLLLEAAVVDDDNVLIFIFKCLNCLETDKLNFFPKLTRSKSKSGIAEWVRRNNRNIVVVVCCSQNIYLEIFLGGSACGEFWGNTGLMFHDPKSALLKYYG